MMKRLIFTLIFALTATLASAQYSAIRVNTLALATGSLNAGVDVAVSPKWSVDLSAMWSPLLNHSTAISAGVHRWRFEPNVGWAIGLHSTFARYHINRSQGWTLGVGSSLRYSWILSRRWSLSLEGGLALFYLHDRWLVADTSPMDDIIIRHRQRIMLLPSKLEVSLSYLF